MNEIVLITSSVCKKRKKHFHFSTSLSCKVGIYLWGDLCFVLPLSGSFLQVKYDSLKCFFLFISDKSDFVFQDDEQVSFLYVVSQRSSE